MYDLLEVEETQKEHLGFIIPIIKATISITAILRHHN